MRFCRLMATAVGRAVRILAGLALIGVGLAGIGGAGGLVVAVVGFVPLVAGLLNYCLVAPFLGCSLSGRDAKKA